MGTQPAKWLSRTEARHQLGGVPPRTFVRLLAEGIPRKGVGAAARFPFPKILTWYIARQVRLASERAGAGGDAVTVALKRREHLARVELAEMKAAEMRGASVSKEAYRAEITAVVQALRGRMLAAPQLFAAHLVSLPSEAAAREALRGVVEDLMTQLRTSMADAPPIA